MTTGRRFSDDEQEAEAAFHPRGLGASAYPPKLLLKLLLYGYLQQRFSSRRISEACREDLAFLWLSRLRSLNIAPLRPFGNNTAPISPGGWPKSSAYVWI